MISAIVLAAGTSKRYGKQNKLLAKYKNKIILLTVIDKLLKSKVDELIIVTGQDRTKVKKQIPHNHKITIVNNKYFKKGMASSIKVGLGNLNKKSKGFLICLSDMPKISTKTYDKIILSFQKHKRLPVVPFYKKFQGNPVCFPNSFKKYFKKLNGDIGAKNLIKEKKFKRVKILNKSILIDFDYKKDFKS